MQIQKPFARSSSTTVHSGEEEGGIGILQILLSLLKVTISPYPAQSGKCHGGSQDSPLHGEGIFLPSRYAKPGNIKAAPQETRAVTRGQL